MTTNRAWTPEEIEQLIVLREGGATLEGIGLVLGRTMMSVAKRLQRLRKQGRLNEPATSKADQPEPPIAAAEATPPASSAVPATARRVAQQEAIRQAAIHTPIDTQPLERIRSLEAENAKLREQLAWAQRAEATERTGGLFTLRASDHHYGDGNHLLSCGRAMQAKVAVLVEQYKPDQIQIIAGDDWIAGRGIYKEQDLDMVTSDVHGQLMVGAVKARELLLALRKVSDAAITWRIMRGNHDYANSVSTVESLFYMMQSLNEDIPAFKVVMHWDSITANLAFEGTYNVLVRHGFGYAKHAPSSPSFIEAVKDEIIAKQRRMQPHEHYRRVLAGHSHWFNIGTERQVGLYWDTTGGLQRNTRIRLGANQRPVGWICYVSLPGQESEILAPIGVQPDDETYWREIADPHLNLANQEDAAASIRQYHAIMKDRGAFGDPENYGVINQGRW